MKLRSKPIFTLALALALLLWGQSDIARAEHYGDQTLTTYMPVICGDRTPMVNFLMEEYGERQTDIAISSDNPSVIEVWQDRDLKDPTFSVLATEPGGHSCIIASGSEWERQPYGEAEGEAQPAKPTKGWAGKKQDVQYDVREGLAGWKEIVHSATNEPAAEIATHRINFEFTSLGAIMAVATKIEEFGYHHPFTLQLYVATAIEHPGTLLLGEGLGVVGEGAVHTLEREITAPGGLTETTQVFRGHLAGYPEHKLWFFGTKEWYEENY